MDEFQSLDIIREQEININGMYAYAITANFTTISYDVKGEQQLFNGTLYQVVTGNDDMGLIFAGQAYTNVDTELETFEMIAKTLKIKKIN